MKRLTTYREKICAMHIPTKKSVRMLKRTVKMEKLGETLDWALH